MSKKLCTTLAVSLPDDLFQGSDIIAQVKPAWDALTERLKTMGTNYEFNVDVLEQRKRPGRPRKPRLVTPPPEAA